jgi:DNA polymerase III epsilon subunit-like protein
MIASIDFETTGLKFGWHEPIQLAVVALDDRFEPCDIFQSLIRPEHPERQSVAAAATHGMELPIDAPSAEIVADRLAAWCKGRRLSPLAHNWSFEYGFLGAWLGEPLRDELFSYRGRDTAVLAAAVNDRAVLAGREAPFKSVSLAALCRHFGVVNEHAHDALSDALATARLYRRLLETG